MLPGREAEQRAIDALLAAARVGQGSALILTGDPGIGKTALLEEAATSAAAAGCRLLRARGTESERELPFAGLAQLVAPLAAGIDDLPAPQARALRVALAEEVGPPPDRFAVAVGLLGLVSRAAEDGPVGVLVDDGHLLDRPSADALLFLCRRLLAESVFVLVTLRVGSGSPWDAPEMKHLTLHGLAPEAAREVVTRMATQLSPADVLRVLEGAAGNPLALVELARHPDLLVDLRPAVPPPVTDVLIEAFARRARGLDEVTRQVLTLLAVADGDVALAARAAAADGMDMARLAAAEELGLVHPSGPGRLQFVHALARAAVYAEAPPTLRRRLHALVADVLPDGELDARAWHRAAAVLGVDESVALDLVEVAGRASRRAAHAVAVTALERAAELSTDAAEAGRRLLAAGEEAWYAGNDAHAARLLSAALDGAPPGAERARAEALLGLVSARAGDLGGARDRLMAAAADAAGQAPAQAVLTYADAIDVCFYLLDLPAAETAARAAQTLLEAFGRDLPPTVCGIGWVAVGMVAALAGEPAGEPLARGVGLLAAEESEAGGASVVQSGWYVLGPLFLRDSVTGRDLVERAVVRRRESSSVGTLPHLLFHVARDDATSDRWSTAAAEYGEAIALARELGQVVELGASLAGLAWLTARQGREQEARRLADEALRLARSQGCRFGEAWCRFALAELDLAGGDSEGAAAGFEALNAWLAEAGGRDPDLSPVPELVEAWCRTGQPMRGEAAAAAFDAAARRKGRPWARARAARTRGLLATSAEEREECFREAARLHDLTLDRFEAARTALVHGELLRRDRRRRQSREALIEALTGFDALGARQWAERARAELAATGLTAHRREAGPVLDLTPREFQIAQLLAEGDSTRQAAQALFLSPKTVEYHLRHVYTKLGIASRTELAEALRKVPR